MKYNQPYGVSDPNGPYINGNPSTGTMGSIPPAASIEFPQREIVRVISETGLTPDNADLTQLMKAEKRIDVFNVFKGATNGGSASQWSAAVPTLPTMPPPVKTAIWFKPGYDSVIQGAVFSVNGSPFFPVVHPDLEPITKGDIVASAWIILMFDGSFWQVIAGASRAGTGTLPLLQANAHWYVNDTTGNDTNYDGTSATVVSASIGPFKTIQRAAAEVLKWNMNGYDQYIHIANGNYTGPVYFHTTNGAGNVWVEGNIATPASVSVTNGSGEYAFFQDGGIYYYNGVRLTAPGQLDGLSIQGGDAKLFNAQFGPCGRAHILVARSGANIMIGGGTIRIEAGATADSHLHGETAGFITYPVPTSSQWPILNILGAVSLNYFITAHSIANVQMRYQSVINPASVTGMKYYVYLNAVLNSIGGGAANYPGNVAGLIETGGQAL